MCLELALEGERLCKAGDCRAGVAFLRAALQAGTDDLRTLSAVYSQLGNAYFYLGDYPNAMLYHKHDLTLARKLNDKLGEAKASGNLGNTLKVMGKFSEAIQCCKMHLEISRTLGDRLSEGRALYNLGNVYHAQGKHLGRVGQNDPGHFPQEVRDCLLQAVTYYEQNLELMRSMNDRAAMGRACGNLGNTCYLLGDFTGAIRYHTERLRIAKEFDDKAAERRANSNLGNSHIFLGQFENAAEHYKRTLALAATLGDCAVEAQACYSLGNTYTLLREYRAAEEYHARHLALAQRLGDRVGEGRACWSLGNAHAALGNHERALHYATQHFQISKELSDHLGMATALMNISDLRKVLGLPADSEEEAEAGTAAGAGAEADENGPRSPFNALRVRRQSMEQLSLIQITPDAKKKEEQSERKIKVIRAESEENPVESFFDLLSRCQAERMDEQRASLHPRPISKAKPPNTRLQRSASSGSKTASSEEAMLDMITDMQSDRMDSQRAELRPLVTADKREKVEKEKAKEVERDLKGASLPGLRPQRTAAAKPEEDFLEMIARYQGSRIDDQRSELPRATPAADARRAREGSVGDGGDGAKGGKAPSAAPDDDFFALLMRAQAAGRMEEQRAAIPILNSRVNKSGSNSKK